MDSQKNNINHFKQNHQQNISSSSLDRLLSPSNFPSIPSQFVFLVLSDVYNFHHNAIFRKVFSDSFVFDDSLDAEYLDIFQQKQNRPAEEESNSCSLAFINLVSLLDVSVKSEPEEDQPFEKELRPIVIKEQFGEQIKDDFDEQIDRFINNVSSKISKKWLCHSCSRSFSNRNTLNRHQETHTNARNHKCTDCGKAFRQVSTLLQHSVIHSERRPFKCEFCSKTFNRISTLISHRKIHCEEKPFQCHVCEKKFHQKGNLRNHIYVHTNERPYHCSYCKKGFNQMSNLMCHKEKQHSDQLVPVWACNRCDAKFQKRNILRQHELDMHQIKEVMSSSKKRLVSKRSYEEDFPASTSKKSLTKKPKVAMPLVTNPPAIKNESQASSGILIPAIRTDAWKKVHQKGDIPFAILNLQNVIPLLVRVYDCENGQSLLLTATEGDFQACRKQDGDRASVPVVATVTQVVHADGTATWSVQPPKDIYKFKEGDNNLKLQYGATVNGPSTSITSSLTSRSRTVNGSSCYLPASSSTAVIPNPRTVTSTAPAQYANYDVPNYDTITSLLSSTKPEPATDTSPATPFDKIVSALQSDGYIPNYEAIQKFLDEHIEDDLPEF